MPTIQLKLSLKIFTLFASTLFLVLIITATYIRWSIHNNFLTYVNLVEKEGIISLTHSLEGFYQANHDRPAGAWKLLNDHLYSNGFGQLPALKISA